MLGADFIALSVRRHEKPTMRPGITGPAMRRKITDQVQLFNVSLKLALMKLGDTQTTVGPSMTEVLGQVISANIRAGDTDAPSIAEAAVGAAQEMLRMRQRFTGPGSS